MINISLDKLTIGSICGFIVSSDVFEDRNGKSHFYEKQFERVELDSIIYKFVYQTY